MEALRPEHIKKIMATVPDNCGAQAYLNEYALPGTAREVAATLIETEGNFGSEADKKAFTERTGVDSLTIYEAAGDMEERCAQCFSVVGKQTTALANAPACPLRDTLTAIG